MTYKTHVANPKNLYVKVCLTDFDGVHAKAGYDTTGKIMKGPDKETDVFFEKMRGYNSKKGNVPVILTSGRSLEQMRGAARRSGNKNLIISEHGMMFYDQQTDTKTVIFDVVPELMVYKDALSKLAQIRGLLRERSEHVKSALDKYRPDDISVPYGKEVSATMDIPYRRGKVGQVAYRLDRMEFFKAVWSEVAEFKSLMFTNQKELMGIVPAGKNLIEVTLDQAAVNFRPPITKPDALRYLISHNGPLYRDHKIMEPNQVGLVDDRDIGSMTEMARLGGKVFTVANGSEEVLDCVQTAYHSGGAAYISEKNDIHGLVDVLTKINRRNPW